MEVIKCKSIICIFAYAVAMLLQYKNVVMIQNVPFVISLWCICVTLFHYKRVYYKEHIGAPYGKSSKRI